MLGVNESKESKVIIYHDETDYICGKKLRGHVLLFIPVRVKVRRTGGLFSDPPLIYEPFNNIFEEIKEVRKRYNINNHRFHFTDISGRKWSYYNEAERKFIQIGVEALRQQKSPNCRFCKLGIIFYMNPKPNSISFYSGEGKKENRMRFGETLLRMLLKGTVHNLYGEDHKVEILNIITDGQPNHRKLDQSRIISRLDGQVRNYVRFSSDTELIHISSDHKNYEKDTDNYKNSNMLQLTDMLLGSVICSCFKGVGISKQFLKKGDSVINKKEIIAYPVQEMLNKQNRKSGFKNSSHYKAFTISEAFIQNNEWKFKNLKPKKVKNFMELNQLDLSMINI